LCRQLFSGWKVGWNELFIASGIVDTRPCDNAQAPNPIEGLNRFIGCFSLPEAVPARVTDIGQRNHLGHTGAKIALTGSSPFCRWISAVYGLGVLIIEIDKSAIGCIPPLGWQTITNENAIAN
jgi:hypothetical protein